MEKTDLTANRGGRAKTLLAVVAVLAVLCALLPYIAAQRYALFCADDFSYAVAFKTAAGSTRLAKIFNYTVESRAALIGTYMSTFFTGLLDPMIGYSYAKLRVTLMLLVASAILSAAMLSWTLSRYLKLDRRDVAALCAIIVLSLLMNREYSEIYNWFCGAVNYLLPMVFFGFGAALLLLGKLCGDSKPMYVLSGINIFCMTGANLEVVAMGMVLLLYICVFDWMKGKKPDIAFIVVFCVGLTGALIGALSPGNFVRLSGTTAPMPLTQRLLAALTASIKCCGQECAWLFGKTPFLLFFAGAFFLGLDMKKSSSIVPHSTYLAVPALLLLPILTVFPVMFGYNGRGISSMTSRTLFHFDLSLLICWVGIATILGCCLSVRLREQTRRASPVIASALLALALLLSTTGVFNCVPLDIAKNLKNGCIEQFSVEWRVVYDYLYECGYEDVVVHKAMPEERAGCALGQLAAYPENWVNVGVAEYFGVKSVCLNPPVLDEATTAAE